MTDPNFYLRVTEMFTTQLLADDPSNDETVEKAARALLTEKGAKGFRSEPWFDMESGHRYLRTVGYCGEEVEKPDFQYHLPPNLMPRG